MTASYWDNNQAINLKQMFFIAQAVAPMMRGRRRLDHQFHLDRLHDQHPDMPAYTTAKAGILGLTKGLAGQLGPENIRVNAIAPGMVITERQRELWLTDERMAAMSPGSASSR